MRLSKEQIQAMNLPNGPQSLGCYAWMLEFFKMMGDSMPNVDEIHLEPIDIKDIYEEYVDDAKSSGIESLSASNFVKVWRLLFSHVKIREFKAVTGKCSTCAKLSDARKNFKDQARRTYITDMHYLHRSAYMNERMKYAERRQMACNLPKSYLSIIIDGMAQNHCKLPWYCNLKDSENSLPQHLQGVLNHGRGFTIYRTFHNIRTGANLAIHTFLCTLEDTLKEEGCLPDTIFLQIDGGSENTAKCVLGVCELLVARRVTKKLVLSRLIVGHTHEDIDAVFAKIWIAVRDQAVVSPQAYEEILKRALREKKNVKIQDIFVLPDYLNYFQPFVDTKLSNYSKGSNTQLQFIFEAVDPSEFFPHGVKTTYRAYASDIVVKIIENKQLPCCFEAVNEETVVYPESKILPDGTRQPEGMFVLRKLPNESDVMKPMGFLENSREFLINVGNKVHKDLELYNARRAQDWVDFVDTIAPQTNDVSEYLFGKELHIPMRDILFANNSIDLSTITTISSKNSLPTVKTVPTVRWSGNIAETVPKNKKRTSQKSKDNMSRHDEDATVKQKSNDKGKKRKNSETNSEALTMTTTMTTSDLSENGTLEVSERSSAPTYTDTLVPVDRESAVEEREEKDAEYEEQNLPNKKDKNPCKRKKVPNRVKEFYDGRWIKSNNYILIMLFNSM